MQVIVVGTGLEESILAGAAARNGHSVLHLDTKDYYGGDWAAFNFSGIQDWVQKSKNPEKIEVDIEGLQEQLQEDERVLVLEAEPTISNVKEEWFASEERETEIAEKAEEPKKEEQESSEKVREDDPGPEADAIQDPAEKQHEPLLASPKPLSWTQKKIQDESRRFNLDLMPKLLFSRGSMVELLISSNISRYTEFKSVSRVLTLINGSLEHVPSSRADVFATKHVSVVEKRILMKFLTFCVNYESQMEKIEPFKQGTYKDFLKHEKLTENLIHFVLHSIAMVDDNAPCEDGLRSTQKFLSSLGRFGNTPFLWSMYGAGEMPQAFCRLCAVFGGTYFLGRSIEAIVVSDKDSTAKAVFTNGQRISCSKLVLPKSICPKDLKINDTAHAVIIRREMALLSESILPHDKEQLTFLTIPPQDPEQSSYAYVQEVGFGAAACPRGMYCLQITKKEESTVNIRDEIVGDKSKLLWSLTFDLKTHESTDEKGQRKLKNLFCCNGPQFELDYDLSIAHARKLFGEMFEGEDFLPRAPEPEEIILGGDASEETPKGEEENQSANEVSHPTDEKIKDSADESGEKREEDTNTSSTFTETSQEKLEKN